VRGINGCNASPALGDGIAVYGPSFAPTSVKLDTVRVDDVAGDPVVRFGPNATVTASGGLYAGCAAGDGPAQAPKAVVGTGGGACSCRGTTTTCTTQSAKRVAALAGVDGCDGDDRIFCLDSCNYQALSGPTTNMAYYGYYALPRDGVAAGVATDGCARFPEPVKTEALFVTVGKGMAPQMIPAVTAPANTPRIETWYLWDASWYGLSSGILGAPWSLDSGVLQFGVFSRMKWTDPTTRQATCYSQSTPTVGDAVPDCVPGVKVELSAPSSGLVYNRADKFPDPRQPGDRTSISGAVLAVNLPPGNHEIRVHLPPGVRCSALLDGTDRAGGGAWPADNPDNYRLPIVAGMITATAIYCDDDRPPGADAGAPFGDGG
jgi:hypothetical protein